MTTCTFLCDDPVIDTYFYAHLRRAVMNLANVFQEIDFVFTTEALECSLLCLCAVMETQQAYPDKQIQITVLNPVHAKHRTQDVGNRWQFPACALDRIAFPPISIKCDDSLKYKRIDRWMIDHSDYLICYHYTDIHTDNQIHDYARRSKAVLIDLTEQDTAWFIRSCIPHLTLEQQWLKLQREQGVTLRALGEQYHRSYPVMSTRIAELTNKLKRYAVYNVARQGRSDPFSQPAVCGVLLGTDPLSAEELFCFEQAAAFIIGRFPLSRFLVAETCPAEPMASLAKRVNEYSNFHTSELHVLGKSVSLKDILNRSNMILCATGQHGLLPALRRKSYETPRLKVFNISHPLPATVYLGTGEAVRC